MSGNATRKVTVGLSISYSGPNYTLTLAPALSAVDVVSEITRVERSPVLYTGTGSAFVALPESLSLRGNLSWQMASEDLLPGDQRFQIGGPTTVRGYPTNSVSGDQGYLIGAELHRSFDTEAGRLALFGFVDHGAIYSTHPAHVAATSVGIGSVWTVRPEVAIETAVSFPLAEIVPNQDDFQIYGRLVFRPQF